MIEFSRVAKFYPGGFQALHDVSFALERGELAVLTGHSGAGKSTVLRLTAALERPSSGRILIRGQDVGALRGRALPYLRRQFGLVFQDYKLLYDRTVFDNVALPLHVTQFRPADVTRRVHAALDKVGLLERAQAMPITLSGGEQQRVCIARAIVHRPAVLLADEPTGNLDPDYARAIADLFRSFNQVGVTVLIATHDPGLIDRLRPRGLALRQGRLEHDSRT